MEDQDRRYEANPTAGSFNGFREQAFSLLSSPQAKDAFSIDRESAKTRDRYGRNEWGESILMARRLIEAGVRLVTISWMYIQKSGNVANVWDNHGPFEGKSGYEMLKAEYCLPSLDRGFDALITDLSSSGLLDETLVAMFGEFGRTPKINKNSGRDHWGAVQSVFFAGGGVKGGNVIGASDRIGGYPIADPQTPENLGATIYRALGLPSTVAWHDKFNRPHQVYHDEPIEGLL